MKLCRDCDHYQPKTDSRHPALTVDYCGYPDANTDPVTGKQERHWSDSLCTNVRANVYQCGWPGQWWTPKIVPAPQAAQPTGDFDARVEAALKAMWYHPDAEIGTSFWDKWVKNKPAMAAALRAADALSPPSPALPAEVAARFPAPRVPEEIVRRLPPSGYQMEPSKWPSDYWISVGDLIEFAHGRGKD